MRGPQVFCLSPERNKGLEGIDLAGIIIDTASLDGPVSDDSVRPDGIGCKVKAWSPGLATTKEPDLNLLLTELPDTTGQLTYFHVPNKPAEDELVNINRIVKGESNKHIFQARPDYLENFYDR